MKNSISYLVYRISWLISVIHDAEMGTRLRHLDTIERDKVRNIEKKK